MNSKKGGNFSVLGFIFQGIASIIAFFFKTITAFLSFTVGVIADLFFNHKDKELLSQKEYLKARNRRAENRINKCIDSRF